MKIEWNHICNCLVQPSVRTVIVFIKVKLTGMGGASSKQQRSTTFLGIH